MDAAQPDGQGCPRLLRRVWEQGRVFAPPIARLSATLGEYEREIEADLAFRGIDLRDLWRPGGGKSKMTYRRLGVLLDALPGDSAYKTAVRDQLTDEQLAELATQPRDKHGRWAHSDLLVAAMVDEVRMLRRDIVAVNGGTLKGEFIPIARPGVPRTKRRILSAEGFNYLQALREQHELEHGYSTTPLTEVG